MLVFIGLGLHDEKDMTLRGLEEARSCHALFAEFYTSRMSGTTIGRLEELIGKEITLLQRQDVEEKGRDTILNRALKEKIGFLVVGDPLISTTHVHLRLEAREMGIETRVVHNASIYSAGPSISGLQNYKFGQSTSIVKPEKDFFPETPYHAIRQNKERGLHTLVFLDIKVEGDSTFYMKAREGMEILLEMEKKIGEKVLSRDTICVALGNVGSNNYSLLAGKIGHIMNVDLGEPPHSLIIPGDMHFMEEDYLKAFGGL